ncbi:MAG: hypothetical protein MUE60_07485, partial [Candidatus Eisenbacteria bacterium]|nr:hypothetical protein [Candidatus Eisenbacteria bacterium]
LPEICGLFAASVLAIPTNGQDTGTIVPMVREIVAGARARVVISLSVDGSETMHDAIRGAGTWRRAWSTFEELREIKGISLKVNTVVTSSNVESLPAFAAYVRARGADAHSLILLRGDPRDPSLRPPLPADLRRIGPLLLNELRSYGYAQGGLKARLLWRYHRAAWSTSVATIEQERQVVPCLAGRNHLVIWPDRTAGPCELLPPVGCIEPAGLGPLISGSAWRERCDFIAGGGCWCTHNCALLASLLFHPPSVIRLIASAAGAS